MTESNNTNDQTRTHVVLTEGIEVGQYRILSKIGAGGMGEVYLAEDSKLRRRVALKFLPAHLAEDSGVRARFVREAQAAAGLDHPNIVTVHEVSEFAGRPFFAMQYVSGKTLRHYAYHEPLELRETLEVIRQVADGLAKAHSAGVVHRDIKSVNIVLDEERRPKILDFGLVAVSGGEALTKVGSTLGTISYMSPEQARGEKVDHRSDLFSLGVVLYEALTAHSPFQKDKDASTLYSILNEEPEPLVKYRGDVSDSLQRIVTRCLRKDPSARYQSAQEVATDLRAEIEALSGSGSGPTVETTKKHPSLAVLPFANMSADPDNEFFADGLTEELLNVLAKNPELKVTGRTSSFAFKGKLEDLRGIGQKLGVETLLEGSVRKAGNRVRITAQLVNARDGFHLWSETYDRTVDDIFAVQDEIATEVSKALDVTLLGKDKEKHTVNPESHTLVLRGNFHILKHSKSSIQTAIRCFEEALELDSQNARALSGLATAHIASAAYGYGDTQKHYGLGKELVLKSLSLDDQIAETHFALGWIQLAFEYDIHGGVKSFRRSLELSPGNSRALIALAMGYGFLGKYEQALELAEKAIEIDPLDPDAARNYGNLLSWTERFEDARKMYRQALELSPDITAVYATISDSYMLEGRYDEALECALKEKTPGYRLCSLAIIYHKMGKTEEAEKALDELLECGTDWGLQIALVYSYFGDIDKAFEWLETSAGLHDAGIPLITVKSRFKNLRTDPRWKLLLRKIGFPED